MGGVGTLAEGLKLGEKEREEGESAKGTDRRRRDLRDLQWRSVNPGLQSRTISVNSRCKKRPVIEEKILTDLRRPS